MHKKEYICPLCMSDSKFMKKIPFITSKKSVVAAPGHDEEHDYVEVGLAYNTFSQLYADMCTKCGTVVRVYINK